MVFQKLNPFPKSIYENVARGARINGFTGNMDDLVEESLSQAALWDEVKDSCPRVHWRCPAVSSNGFASPGAGSQTGNYFDG